MTSREDPRSHALHLLESALQLLDDSDAPADIGAHVHTAILRLSEVAVDETGHVAKQRSQAGEVPAKIGKAS